MQSNKKEKCGCLCAFAWFIHEEETEIQLRVYVMKKKFGPESASHHFSQTGNTTTIKGAETGISRHHGEPLRVPLKPL